MANKLVLVTGSAGLIGSEVSSYFAERGFAVIGIDNDMRAQLFGADASTLWNRKRLIETIADYTHVDADIRDMAAMTRIFEDCRDNLALVVHTAAQPSHDKAADDALADFTINANGTLNLLELVRKYCREVPFIFTSTNKVYGDLPNQLPLRELPTRWELESGHAFAEFGIDESMSVDRCLHSLFGASKLSADILVQEYGRYFDMQTVCFRGGCLTGPGHSGTKLHGFLAYLMRCTATGLPYSVFGYAGKQVRDNIHSRDLVEAFWQFFQAPRSGEVYNIGGGRACNCSMLEAIELCETISGKKLNWAYEEANRIGDHIWWISDTRRFEEHYPDWKLTHNIEEILVSIYEFNRERWRKEVAA